MTRRDPIQRPRLTQVATPPRPRGHIQPTEAQRAAADTFLRGEPVAATIRTWLERALASFDEIQHNYIDEARRQGEHSLIWDTTGWIVANAIAREADQPDGR